VRAGTAGVGELVLAAVRAGARRIVVGVGGSATTDGGRGAVEAVGSRDRLEGAELVVACDVRTPFRQAAEVFGPQKGATPEQVAELTRRLDGLAGRYRRLGVDVDRLPGAGAAGGLAGGLAALGARLVPGFDLVAELVGLAGRLAGADLVMTGEGCLDATSFDGKVVGGVVAAAGGRAPVLCVVGSTEPGGLAAVPAGGPVTVVDLSRRFGVARARRDVLELVAVAVAERVGTAGPP
ncbi:MAG: glycerate kinase, partial [Acidimicrobiales bacterium]